MIDPVVLQIVPSVLTGWLDRREREAIAYLIEENLVSAAQSGTLPALRRVGCEKAAEAPTNRPRPIRCWPSRASSLSRCRMRCNSSCSLLLVG